MKGSLVKEGRRGYSSGCNQILKAIIENRGQVSLWDKRANPPPPPNPKPKPKEAPSKLKPEELHKDTQKGKTNKNNNTSIIDKGSSNNHTNNALAKPNSLVQAHLQYLERSRGRQQEEMVASLPSPPVEMTHKVTQSWACIKNCGACCKLDKGPEYPPVEEVLMDPKEVQMYKSMVGRDGWCKFFDKSLRMCKIYEKRPRFCHVDPETMESLYGIPPHKLDKEACSLCRDAIKDVYGCKSKEWRNFEAIIASLKKSDPLTRRLEGPGQVKVKSLE